MRDFRRQETMNRIIYLTACLALETFIFLGCTEDLPTTVEEIKTQQNGQNKTRRHFEVLG